MRPSAQVERFRMALEVIASGPEWEPGTMVAKIALTDPWVSQEAIAIRDDIDWLAASDRPSVREAVEQARAEEMAHETTDEPQPISLAELDEELDAELDEAAKEVVETEVPPQRKIEKRGQDGLLPTEREILAWIREKREVTPEQVRTKFGLHVERQKRYAKTLIERGLIVGVGERASRVYRSGGWHSERTSQDKPTMPDPEPAPSKVEGAGRRPPTPTVPDLIADTNEAKRNGPGSDQGRLLESVSFKPGWSIAQHASRLDLHQDKVAAAMRALEDEGEVKSSAKGGRVVWGLR